ncbi:MAG: hypothetical protein Q9157_001847 [Trypethelium eluteriae]
MDLVRVCQEWNAMVETPIVGFTIYTVAFFGVYCGNFPWMDPDGFMCKRNATASSPEDSSGAEVARKSLEVLSLMRSRLRMADGWFKTIERLHLYFGRMKKDWKKNTKALESSSEGGTAVSPEAYRHLSLREGGPGGGLEEYKLLEKTLKEFGTLEDDDLEMTDSGMAPNEPDPSDAGAVIEAVGPQSKPKAMSIVTQQAPDDINAQQEHWNAINNVAGTPATAQVRLATANMPDVHQTPSLYAPTVANPYQTNPHEFRSGYVGQHHASAVPTPPSVSPASQPTVQTSSIPSPYSGSSYSQAQNPPPKQYSQQNYPSMQTYFNPATQTDQTHSESSFRQSNPQSWSQQNLVDPRSATAWTRDLHPSFSGDDLAAFAAGGEMQTWAGLTAEVDGVGGWLSAVWGDGTSGM